MLAEQIRDEVFDASVSSQLELIDAALLKAAEADSDMVTEAAQHGGGLQRRHEHPCAVPGLEDPERHQRADRLADRTPGHPQRSGQLPLGWQSNARLGGASLDHPEQLVQRPQALDHELAHEALPCCPANGLRATRSRTACSCAPSSSLEAIRIPP